MKIFLADGQTGQLVWACRAIRRVELTPRILVSYWYFKKADLKATFDPTQPEIFADSGGFTADSMGVSITVEEYATWIKQWWKTLDYYINLDVIGDQLGTNANQEKLEALGVRPLPIFTLSRGGSDYGILQELVEQYNYICLGGLVPFAGQVATLMPHFIRCFKIAQGKAVFHGLGLTSLPMMKMLPWFSTDSSSWGQGHRYGTIPLFDDVHGLFVRANVGDRPACYKYGHLIKRAGFTPDDFAIRENFHWSKAAQVSAISFALAERWLTRLHGDIEIPKGVK